MRKKRKSQVIDGGTAPDLKEELITLKPIKPVEVVDGGKAPDKTKEEIFREIALKGFFRAFHILLILLVLLSIFSFAYDIIVLFRPPDQQTVSIYPNPFRSGELFSNIKDLLLIIILVLIGRKSTFLSRF